MLIQRLGFLFVVLSFLTFFKCESKRNFKKNVGSRTNVMGKVVGGTPVSIDKFPFAVQFMNSGNLCGGVIIHSWAIITAAHCLKSNKDKKKMYIQAAARYLHDIRARTYKVLHFVQHEEYMKETPFSCDIALVFPVIPFKFGNKIKKAILVTHDKWMDEKENTFIVAGWGLTGANGAPSKVGLQMTHLRYVSPEKCTRLFNDTITSDMFCLYGGGKRGSCRGDSGGGVIWNDMLVGITSYGSGCGQKYVPTVYTNIWVMRDWINKTLNRFSSFYCYWKFSIKPTKPTMPVPKNNIVESLEIFI